MNIPLFQPSKIDTTSYVFPLTIIPSSPETLFVMPGKCSALNKGKEMGKVIVVTQYIIIYAAAAKNSP